MVLYLGCPIWAFKGWVGEFFPKGTKSSDFLREYARRLTTVEGNTTFYAIPAQNTLQRWVEETPETFRFCPKLPRTISHTGKLMEHLEEAQKFIEVMSQLGNKLGPMFLQLPPRYPPAWLDDLREFLEAWPQQVQLAVEVRHPGWFNFEHDQTLNTLLSKQNIARVIIDTRPIRSLRQDKILQGSVYLRLLQARERKPDVPIVPELTSSFTFLRFIGHPQMEENIPIIDEWADQLADWLRQGTDAYVFCHCPDERLDPWICREFHQRVSAKILLQPLPWDEVDSKSTTQTHLC
jgi:uncharacterized protein YecE (DUF72 family)